MQEFGEESGSYNIHCIFENFKKPKKISMKNKNIILLHKTTKYLFGIFEYIYYIN